jgi:hypothetical protein
MSGPEFGAAMGRSASSLLAPPFPRVWIVLISLPIPAIDAPIRDTLIVQRGTPMRHGEKRPKYRGFRDLVARAHRAAADMARKRYPLPANGRLETEIATIPAAKTLC